MRYTLKDIDEEVEVPDNIVQFIEEYKALCEKHQICIISEGEEIEAVVGIRDDYWGIMSSTARSLHYEERRKRGDWP